MRGHIDIQNLFLSYTLVEISTVNWSLTRTFDKRIESHHTRQITIDIVNGWLSDIQQQNQIGRNNCDRH